MPLASVQYNRLWFPTRRVGMFIEIAMCEKCTTPDWGRILWCGALFYKHPTALPSFSFIAIGIYSSFISIFNPHQLH
jgi:hypothetical protein